MNVISRKKGKVGEVKFAKELGYKVAGRYTFLPCVECGKPRWVRTPRGKPQCLLCGSCQTKLQKLGKRSGNWKGGRHRRGKYIVVWVDKDDFFYPMADERGYIREHRLVMAKSFGRCLQSWELVHHINSIKDDNRLDNLQLVSEYGHKQFLVFEKRITDLEKRVLLVEAENMLLREQLSRVDEYEKDV